MTEQKLYTKSVKASLRYMPVLKFAEIETAIKTVQREYYRIGWMRGYRAGRKSK